MTEHVYTFWEGPMPAYIYLCMRTWCMPFTILTFDNLNNYTDLPIDSKLVRFSLPQIADCVRVHVLRDQGGYWLDADTIMVADTLPDVNIMGDPITRSNAIGMLYTEPRSAMFEEWAEYQDSVLADPDASHHWSVMGNRFSDRYVVSHPDIRIGDIRTCWQETYMIDRKMPRHDKYRYFYFERSYHLPDLEPTSMLMLHNSWTPDWYKRLTEAEVLAERCTLSNILRELVR